MNLTSEKSQAFLAKFLQFIAFLLVQEHSSASPNQEQCAELGFSSQLMCGSCSTLKDFNLGLLEESCLQCCQHEAEDNAAKYVRGQDPIIKLLNEQQEVQETLSINNWNTDSVEEFLNEKLVL